MASDLLPHPLLSPILVSVSESFSPVCLFVWKSLRRVNEDRDGLLSMWPFWFPQRIIFHWWSSQFHTTQSLLNSIHIAWADFCCSFSWLPLSHAVDILWAMQWTSSQPASVVNRDHCQPLTWLTSHVTESIMMKNICLDVSQSWSRYFINKAWIVNARCIEVVWKIH